jgi:hypothetical protein
MIISAANPRWSDPAQSAIILDVVLSDAPSEVSQMAVTMGARDQHIRDLFLAAVQGDFGQIAEYVAEPTPVPQNITFAQLLIGLVAEEWITEAEGEAWLAGTVPAAVSALIQTLPQAQRFAALARAVRPSVVDRSDPLVVALGAANGKTPEQLDQFFTTYKQA